MLLSFHSDPNLTVGSNSQKRQIEMKPSHNVPREMEMY